MFAEKDIQKMMKNLDLTREEAIQLLKDDQDGVSAELTSEQKKVVKAMSRAENTMANVKRTRKPNEKKRFLVREFHDFLLDIGCASAEITNAEREISFVFDNEIYRLTLAKPRQER